jgi:hypothetical protein
MRSYRYGWECRFLKACSRAPYLLDPARHGQTQKNKEKLTWMIHFHKLWAAKLCKSLSAHEASVSFSENPTIQSRRKASLKYLDMNLESEFLSSRCILQHISRKKTSPQLNQFSGPSGFSLILEFNCPTVPWISEMIRQCVDVTHLAARAMAVVAFYRNPFPS